jgi:hypothetical protein
VAVVHHCFFAGVHDTTQFAEIKIIQIVIYKMVKSIAPVDVSLSGSLLHNRNNEREKIRYIDFYVQSINFH